MLKGTRSLFLLVFLFLWVERVDLESEMINVGKKYTILEIEQIIKELGYELINKKYINRQEKLIVKDKQGYFYTPTFSNILAVIKNSGDLAKFHKSNIYTIQNIDNWCVLNDKPFRLIANQTYQKGTEKLKWRCLKEECGEIFEATWSSIYNNRGCGCCTGKQVGLSNCLATKNPETTLEWHPTKNKLTPFEVTYASNLFAWWKCKECNHEWEAQISNRTILNSGCPECNESKGEKKVKEILAHYKFPYDTQHIFNDLIGLGGGLLKYDVPVFWDEEKTQLRMLIEFDGKQHFEWVKQWMTKEEFITGKIHDKLKNEYCMLHNILLVRIPYWEFDKMDSILEDILIFNNLDSKFIINNTMNM